MQPVLPSATEQPLFDVATTRLIEARAAAARPPHALMQCAGLAVARLALALAPHARCIWVAAGPGNNGGDGLEAAMHLLRWGRQVRVSLIGDAAALPADAAHALQRAQAAGVIIGGPDAPDLSPQDLAIDALLGIGASRAPQGALAEAIRQLNALACPVLAVDVPSGLNTDTGQPLGDACVNAAHTLALLTLKPGLFTAAGRDLAGQVWFDDLGIDTDTDTDTDISVGASAGAGATATSAPTAWLFASLPAKAASSRLHAQHKGSFGDVAVVGGASGMAGAGLLAARAALAAGAGRVFVDLLGTALDVDLMHPELMLRSGWSAGPEAVIGASTVVCGCGGGDAVRALLPRLLGLAGRLVLDADALNAVATDTALQALLTHRASRQLPTVLTPHPLEAARLLGSTTVEVQADRLRAAQALADRFACCIVLKGSGSVIAAPFARPRINPTGNAALATAGTGDVLAGWLGGLWAQSGPGGGSNGGMNARASGRTNDLTNHPTNSAFEAAARAVRSHGAAAEPPPPGPLCASALIDALSRSAR
jgi:ADP-dependent NAD(P)H-hydrate dehydratase / NAD(P)H-hydrate epimerase